MKRILSIDVGLFILALAYVVSFFGGLNVTLDLGERIDNILQANPNRYWTYAQDAVIFLVLPPAIGVALSIIAYVKEIKSPTGILKTYWLPPNAFRGFLFVLGGLWNLLDV